MEGSVSSDDGCSFWAASYNGWGASGSFRKCIKWGIVQKSKGNYVEALGSYVGCNDRALRPRMAWEQGNSTMLPRMAKFQLPEKKGADVGVELVRKDEAAAYARVEKTPAQKL